MRIWMLRAVFVFVALFAGWVVAAEPPDLNEVQRLKAENCRLEAALLDAQIQRVSAEIQQSQQALQEKMQALEREFREALDPPADHVWNWQTLTFAAPQKDKANREQP
jgi:hypothetical protein